MQENETIEMFSSELSSLLWSVIPSGTKLDRKERRKMWTSYSRIRTEKLPSMWANFLRNLGCKDRHADPLFTSLVTDAMFEKMIHTLCENYCSARDYAEPDVQAEITEDVQRIIRYACGYVGMKLHNKFLKQHGEKAARFVECINQMYEDGLSSSLLDYTRE